MSRSYPKWQDSSAQRLFYRVFDDLREMPKMRLFILLSIPVLVLGGFFILPLFNMVFLSFHESLPPAPLTLENYIAIFSSDIYIKVIWQTTLITLQTTVIALVLGYVLAYSVVRFTRRSALFLILVILPFWTNYIVRMYSWINILQTGGVLDTVLQFLNIIQEPIGLLYSWDAALIGFVYIYLPLAALTFYASLTDLNPHLIDAAKDLGAGPIKTFFTVTLPMTLDGITVGIILVMIPIFGAFITPAMLGGAKLTMIGQIIERQFKASFNWPLGAALSLVVTVIVIVLLAVSIYLGGQFLTDEGEGGVA